MNNNRNIAAVLIMMALVLITGYTLVNYFIDPLSPIPHGEIFGCCIVVWVFIAIAFVFNKLNRH